MASNHSYTITFENNRSEKEAINYLLNLNDGFFNPSKESRKLLMEKYSIDPKFSKAFDLIKINGHQNVETAIEVEDLEQITFVELKTTKKKLVNNPLGFFFGATESEFRLASFLGDKYKFCFDSLHDESLSYSLKSLSEMEDLIMNKRIQYQINLKGRF